MQVMGANASEAEFKLFIRTIFFPEAVGRKIRPNNCSLKGIVLVFF